MTKNVTDRATAGQRAGLPLARAQRLSAETQKRARKGSAGMLYGVGVLGVIGLVGFGLSTGQSAAPIQAAALQTSAPDRPASATAAVSAPAPAEAAPVLVAVPETEEVAAAPPMTSLPIDTTHPVCVQSVETRLNTLHEMTVIKANSSEQQNALSNLVQAALDCGDTKLKIVGSIELIGTGMADVRVRWDRSDWTLDLKMIDNIEQQAALTSPGITEEAVEFVIR